jgi:DNA-directed RNA polymerase specialized sigma subunit
MAPPEKPITDPDPDRLRDGYLAALDDFEDAARTMRRAIDDASASLSILRRHVGGGGSMSDIATLVEAQPRRAELSSAIDRLERTRHTAQRLLFRSLVAENMSMADIGRMFGISRSLVSRIVNEPG